MKKIVCSIFSLPLFISSCAETLPYKEGRTVVIASRNDFNDDGDNEALFNALSRKKHKFGLSIFQHESTSSDEINLSKSIAYEVSNGNEFIILNGKEFGTQKLNKEINQYPNNKFIILDTDGYEADGGYKKFDSKLITSTTYLVHEAAYLAGYFAAKYYDSLNKPLKVGGFGDYQTVENVAYLSGLKSGIARFVADSGTVLAHSMINLGGPVDHFINSSDNTVAQNKMQTFINAGATVLFPASSIHTSIAIDIIKNTPANNSVKIINVGRTYKSIYPGDEPLFLTSIYKDYDVTIERIISNIVKGNKSVMGKHSVAGLDNDEITIAYNDKIIDEWFNEGMEVKARQQSVARDPQYTTI